MRSILEQAVIHHLNGDAEKAQELFHQFIVNRARQIHESMRNGEDPLAEGWDDQITSEEYFTESDLDELEDLEDEAIDGEIEGEADIDAEDFGGEEGEEEAAEELGDELGLDGEEELGDEEVLGDEPTEETEELEARVEDLEAELERLVAKFDEVEGEDGVDGELAIDLEDDMGGDDEVAADDEDEFRMESEEEDFDGLAEGDQANLEKVSANVADATEVGAGKKIAANGKSGLPQKNAAARQGGEPVAVKSTNHKGFEREAAPAVAGMKKRKNNVEKADANQSAVAAPAKGEGTEQGGKKTSTNTKSPVSPAKGLQK